MKLREAAEAHLSPFAFRESKSRGRARTLEVSALRGEYQRDRDRIIHSKSFRRLMHKTQVFLAPEEEHYRTRLTHTLEVTQIGRTIARALFLNEDLTEAAALGHDLGHTPFGHIGEAALQECYSPEFTHYRQSLRVVDKLERDGAGLDLTYEVRDGIVNHQGSNLASTLEGRIVKFADRIAYINHDIDDAVRAGILSEAELPHELCEILGFTHSDRINTMVTSVVRRSDELMQSGVGEISMEPEIQAATDSLREFLFERVYHSEPVLAEEGRSKELIMRLFEYFVKNPDRMPEFYRSLTNSEPVDRCVCDFISGMTDRHAISIYKQLFIPNTWSGRSLV
ncbi:MAG: deoxyguanosinetriphosphate triphosphohydrolase [Clostridiales bacterium]|nr:deoxyguanosinetriphosphate triphosphohydrolase [Clostridiales bacterium]